MPLRRRGDRSARGPALFALGLLVGVAARRHPVASDTDTRWFEMSNELLAEASLDGYFLRLTGGWEQTLGWSREELMARPFRDFVHPDDLAATTIVADALDRAPGEVVDFENRYRARDGSFRWLQWRVRSDHERKYAVARDITVRKRLEHERQELLDRVEAMALTDELTGLPNRRAWEAELRQAIARAERHDQRLAVALVDIDQFKRFNDAFGHPAGDALLAEAAIAWGEALRGTDFLARYGGEEFGLLLADCPPDEVSGLVERFRAATPQEQSVSVGVAFWDGAERPEELVARADIALYRAKQAGRDRVVTAVPEPGRAARAER